MPASLGNLSSWVQGGVRAVNFTLVAADSGLGRYHLTSGAEECIHAMG